MHISRFSLFAFIFILSILSFQFSVASTSKNHQTKLLNENFLKSNSNAHAGQKAFNTSSLTFMSYNIRSGHNMENVLNLTGTLSQIIEVGPDILALQEVDNLTRRVPIDETTWISQRSALKYTAYAPWRPFQGGQYGISLLSKWPILEVRRHGFVNPTLPLDNLHTMQTPSEPKCAVQVPKDFCQGIVAIKVAPPLFSGGIWIVNTHLAADGSQYEEAKQLESYVASLLKETGISGAMIAGDFNETPDQQAPSYLSKFWIDTFKHCYANEHHNPHGFTFSSEKPTRRIDYIWVTTPELAKCSKSFIPESLKSDHFAYVVQWN